MVSTPRHHTGVVITEYGAAELTGLTVRERAHLWPTSPTPTSGRASQGVPTSWRGAEAAGAGAPPPHCNRDPTWRSERSERAGVGAAGAATDQSPQDGRLGSLEHGRCKTGMFPLAIKGRSCTERGGG